MSKNLYSFSTSPRYRSSYHGVDSIFSWTLFIFFLTGFALFCWMGSFYVFGHPEKPTNYRLLKRLHKLDDPQRFEVTTVPRGEFLKPAQLLERFGHLEPNDRQRLNETLLRHFLRNYHQTRDLIPYAVGTYKIAALTSLTEHNFCSSGVVMLLQAVDQPQVFLEQIFTTDHENLAALQAALTVGEEVKLEKPLDFSAIIFVDTLPQGKIKLTTMPLLYGNYQGEETGVFSLHPPEHLNIDSGLPLFKAGEIAALVRQEYGDIKNNSSSKKGLQHALESQSKILPKKQTPPTSSNSQSPVSSSTATPSVAAAIPVTVPAVLPAAAVVSSLEVSSTKTNLLPSHTPSSIPTTPSATPVGRGKESSELSFSNSITTAAPSLPLSAPTVSPTNNNMSPTNPATKSLSGWPLYDAGKMPRGRLVAPGEIASLAEQGLAGERLYLQGDFVVTASGLDRAVLRYQSASSGLPLSRIGKIRIISVFPTGEAPPTEGASLTRDTLHPFMITDIKRENDGTVNLYVREITKP